MSEQMKSREDAMDVWIDELLSSDVARPSAPAALHTRVRQLRNRKRRRIVACGFAAALAAVLFAPIGAPVSGDRKVVLQPTTTAISPPTANFVPDRDAIVLQQEQFAHNVTIVELIPTTNAAKRWRREALARSIRLRIKSRGGKS